ncbi:MAG: FAD:protein FMN transferase [Polyangiaceae bacterium]|nr:FAD:protein FMN transferase [Polyangiaceae bacterium]
MALLISACLGVLHCERPDAPRVAAPSDAHTPPPTAPAPSATPSPNWNAPPVKVDISAKAMGTEVRVIAFSNPNADERQTRAAIDAAVAEIRRLEDVMTTWRPSELQSLNDQSGQWVNVGPDSLDVLEKSLWAGKTSKGTFDITFASMNDVWKFGDAADPEPKLPSKVVVDKRRKLVDYTKIELDRAGKRARIGKGQRIDVGGIAKGYAVDAAARVLKREKVTDFLVQAGGDLFGSGKKPDGSPWVSGIRDPRGSATTFFATIELTDHAFSTAGDYARSFVKDGKRYHHIIDPRTGWPATACRSVTIWAPDALTADAVDDAVFILGPVEGLALVESLPDVGAVIVDAENQVHVSQRVTGKVKITQTPTDAP